MTSLEPDPQTIEFLENLVIDCCISSDSAAVMNLLLSKPEGTWLSLSNDLHYLPSALDEFSEGKVSIEGDMFVTWTDHPAGIDSTLKLVIFYVDNLLWSKACIYNAA